MKRSLPEMLDDEVRNGQPPEEDAGFGALKTEARLSATQGARRAGPHRWADRACGADADIREHARQDAGGDVHLSSTGSCGGDAVSAGGGRTDRRGRVEGTRGGAAGIRSGGEVGASGGNRRGGAAGRVHDARGQSAAGRGGDGTADADGTAAVQRGRGDVSLSARGGAALHPRRARCRVCRLATAYRRTPTRCRTPRASVRRFCCPASPIRYGWASPSRCRCHR